MVSAVHTRLECDVGAVLSYCVLKSHTASALHTRSLSHSASVEIHWPALCGAAGTLHVVWSLHERSDVCVLATVCHCVALHSVSAVQARSLVTVGAVLWNWLSWSHVTSAAHVRSEVSVGAAVWYSVLAEHALMAVHWRSLVVVAAMDCH